MLYKSNSFSRVRENEAKMGAYYTELSHCRDIHKMFSFPETEEVSVLEPSIGDGRAVIEVTGAANNPNIKIFGIELNDTVADETAKKPHIEEVLKADFTNGVVIRKNCFSFCFANPPYLSDKSDMTGETTRLERQFLERIVNYLKLGGILVWVIPHSQFTEVQHTRIWMRNFETLCIYRFREEEFQKYHQIVVVGRKKAKHEILSMQVSDFLERCTLERLSVLPNDLPSTIQVPSSPSEKVDLFTTREFQVKDAYAFLEKNGLSSDIKKALDNHITVKEFSEESLLSPPIPLKKDSLYLLATSGCGQGFAGSEDNGDLHLQRGVAEVIEETYIPSDGEDYGDEEKVAGKMVVTSRTAVSMTIVQNDGTIHVLS